MSDNKEFNAYIPRGSENSPYNITVGWNTNTDFAIFSNAKWKYDQVNEIRLGLNDFVWYPEIFADNPIEDGAEGKFNDIGYSLNMRTVDNTLFMCKNAGMDPNSNPKYNHRYTFDFYKSVTPTIKLRAFKPNLSTASALLSLFRTLTAMWEAIFKLEGKDLRSVFKSIFDPSAIGTAISRALQKVSFKNSNNIAEFNMMYDGVNALYRRIFTGVYTSSYTMPFYNVSEYLTGSSLEGWEAGYVSDGNMKKVLEMFSSVFDNMNILYNNTWKAENATKTPYPEIVYKFDLFNRTANDVYKNLRFLHTLIPEVLWIQNGIFQNPSTLYDVEIPGRTRLYWCFAQFDGKYKGKTRYFTAFNTKNLMAESHRDYSKSGPKLNVINFQEEADYEEYRGGSSFTHAFEWDNYNENIARYKVTEERPKLVQELAIAETALGSCNDKISKIELQMFSMANEENFNTDSQSARLDTLYEKRDNFEAKIADLQAQIDQIDKDYADAKRKDQLLVNKSKSANIKRYNANSIRPLNIIPDIYELSVKLKSALPNNLNTYLYGMFEHNNFTPKFGEATDRFTHSLMSNLTVELLKTGIENTIGQLSEGEDTTGLQNALDTLNNMNN